MKKKDEKKTNNYHHLYIRVILKATIFSLYAVVSISNPKTPHNKQQRPSTANPYKNYLDEIRYNQTKYN